VNGARPIMSSDNVVIPKADLLSFVSTVFVAAGCSPQHADEWAKMLVWANLRGTDSHGIIRIPRYLDLLKRRQINPTPDLKIEKKSGAIVVIEADRAPGAVAMTMAVHEAVERARDVHIGWCAARNITHSGAIGYFAQQIAEAGFAGIVMSASGPMMAYPGAKVAAVSTNPIAFAIPAKNRRPYLIDFSTATVANGKIMGAKDRGESVPLGWGIDAEGRDTTDPRAIATLLPMAGAKGAGLSFMIECLCSLALSNPRIAPTLIANDTSDNPFLNGVAVAVDVGAFGDFDRFIADADQLGDAISALPKSDGVDRIHLPGERGDAVRAEREAGGIPIPKGTWQRVTEATARLGVPAPV
jgi:ureidoglycolate dehydrogenase (NAD+)